MSFKAFAPLIAFALLLTGCSDANQSNPANETGRAVSCSYPPGGEPAKPVDPPSGEDVLNAGETKATLHLTAGDVEITMDRSATPCTINSFMSLAQQGWFNETRCHRLTDYGIFLLQCGDPTGTGMGGESIYGERFEDEFSPELYNIRGALSMANAGPNTNGSQFFIVQNSSLPYSTKELTRGGWPKPIAEVYASQGGTPHLDRRHTVFGQLVDEASYEVLDKIAAVETASMDKPLEDVVIETIEVID